MKRTLKKKFGKKKSWRNSITGSRRFDRSCRNHGSCDWCVSDRTHNTLRQSEENKIEDQLDFDAPPVDIWVEDPDWDEWDYFRIKILGDYY